MKLICDKRCIIGEGPVWNEKEQKLYFTNGLSNEICKLDIYSRNLEVRSLDFGCAAFCFDKANRLIVSTETGVYILNDDNMDSLTSLCHAFMKKMGVGGRKPYLFG